MATRYMPGKGGVIYAEHDPEWVPAMLRYNRAGDTKPGFECVHELENGNGPCGSNVWDIADGFGSHCCIVSVDAMTIFYDRSLAPVERVRWRRYTVSRKSR